FFFSSRRRHTSSKRDWSSDVCSSDLMNRLESRFDVRLHPGEIQPAGFPARLYEIVGNGHDAVVRAEGHNIVALSDGTVEVGKKEIGRASCRERREKAAVVE